MKKQIVICVLWDVLFLVYLYGSAQINFLLKNYAGRTMNVFPTLWAHVFLLMLCGGIIFLLVYVSSKFQRTVKSALAEFLIIGIPAFYMATAYYLIPMLFLILGVENLRFYSPMWMFRDSTFMDINSILFGYELFLFITRLIQIRRTTKLAVVEDTHLE